MGRDCPSIRGSAATQGEGRRGTAEPVPSESEGPLLRMREWWSLLQRPLGRNLTGGAYPPGNAHPSPPRQKSSLITRSGFPARSRFDAAHGGKLHSQERRFASARTTTLPSTRENSRFHPCGTEAKPPSFPVGFDQAIVRIQCNG